MTWLDAANHRDDTYLHDTVRLLWPVPAELSAGRKSWSLRRGAGRPDESYVVVPGAQRPKILLPLRPGRVSAAALRGFKTTQARREQWILRGLGLAARFGLTSALPDQLHITHPANQPRTDVRTALAERLDRAVFVSLNLSPPRAVRKPVLQLIDETGHTFAFAKLSVDALTADLVDAERRAVVALSAAPLHILRVPRLLHAGDWHGHRLIVQTALASGTNADPDDPLLAQAMTELAAVDGIVRARVVGSTYLARLRERVARLPSCGLGETLTTSLSRLASGGPGTGPELGFGMSHGDWTPWNTNLAEGRVQVWDWEKLERDVPIGFDAIHYHSQAAVVGERGSATQALADLLTHAAKTLAPFGVAADDAPWVVWLYALDLATRYLEDDEPTAGTAPMTRLSEWLPVTLRAAEHRCLGQDPYLRNVTS